MLGNMSVGYKIIRDPIHGNVKINGLFLELLSTPEIQRLYNIKQLGLAHLVFPGAHHTRLEHSLGTYYIGGKIAESLRLSSEDMELICCAALLHDIGHGPFSHTLESILRNSLNVDHIDLTEKLLFGEYDVFHLDETPFLNAKTVKEVLDAYGIDKKVIADMIRGRSSGKLYLSQLINSAIDADQLDYLIRDAYYTGVAYGMIDVERFLQTLQIYDNELAITRKGVGVVENILMARALMYSSVYFHKTVRIAELMLSKSIEMIDELHPFDFFKMTDAEFVTTLKQRGGYQQEIVTRLKYRNLFKQAYMIAPHQLDEAKKDVLKALENPFVRRGKEREFEETLGIPRGHIIVDVPYQELHQAEPRISQTNIPIIDHNEKKLLDDFTPVADAIRMRAIPDWAVMIITDEKYRDLVSERAEHLLFK